MSETEDHPLVPKLVIELEGERAEFLAFENANEWALMEHASSVRKKDEIAKVAALHSLTWWAVKPEERDRFREFMLAHGQDPDLQDVCFNALNALWSGATRLPLVPTSSVSSSSTSTSESPSTDDSSEPVSEQNAPATVDPWAEWGETEGEPVPSGPSTQASS